MKYFSYLKTKRERGDIPLVRNKLITLLAMSLLAVSGYAQAQVRVDLALCIDSSGSIDGADYILQRDATVAALDALVPTNSTVRLSVFQFSLTVEQVVAPTVIDAGNKAATLALITAMSQLNSLTNTDGCIQDATAALLTPGAEAARKIIDVSTDGVPTWDADGNNCNGDGIPNVCSDNALAASVAAEAGGIDALNVIAVGPGAFLPYMEQLPFPAPPVGSPFGDYPNPGDPADTDGFLVPVADFDAYQTAIEQKLIIELANQFTVTKQWIGGVSPGPVSIQLACTGVDTLIDGNPSPFAKPTVGDVATFDVTSYEEGVTCTATEVTSPAGWFKDESGCASPVDVVEPGECTITNTAMNPAITIDKDSVTTLISAAGQIVPYTFLVTNTGNVTLNNITVTDATVDAPGVSCPGNTLAPAAFMTCTANRTVTQADMDTNGGGDGLLDNTGIADSDETDPVQDQHRIPIEQSPSMTIDKDSVTTEITAAGQVVPYTFLVTNTGNVTLTNIVVTDATVDAPGVSCPGNMLAPAAFMTCTANRTVTQQEMDDPAALLVNTGIADSDETPPVNDIHRIPVTQSPSMTIVKDSVTTLITAAGQVVPYTFLVTNTGNVTLTNITVTDVTVDAPGVSCPGNTLAPAADMTCTANRTVTQPEWDAGNGGTLDNIGIADSDETDPVEDPHSIPFADDGRIEIALILVPALPDTFDFLGATPTTLGDGDDYGVNVRPGAYETRTAKAAIFQADWFVVSFDCNDGDSQVQMNDPDDLIALFNVGPNETVRCTLTLRLAPDLPVPVNSPWALLLLTLMMLTAGWYFRPATMRRF